MINIPTTDGSFVYKEAKGAWCIRCLSYWGWPRAPKREIDEVPRRLSTGSWSIHLMPDDTLEVHASGTLDEHQIREFRSALSQANKAVSQLADARAIQAAPAQGRWQLSLVAERLVLHRQEGRASVVSVELVRVCPRKPAACEFCKAALALGEPAWRGVKISWEERGELRKWQTWSVASDWLAKFRACSRCIADLGQQAGLQRPEEPTWPTRGLEC